MYLLSLVGTGLFVVFFFGLCIFIHEFGHLVAALWRGLFVERFSLGFGRKIWGFTHNGVEYIVSALPFGGYVALPQLEPAEEPQTSDGRKLPYASPGNRIIAALAGPFFNFILGFLLALAVWWLGVYRPAPAPYCDVISVPETSPEYQAGLRSDDRIIEVNGQTFERGWSDLIKLIVLTPGEITLKIKRGNDVLDLRYKPAPNAEYEGLGFPAFRVRTPTVIHKIEAGSPAEAGGLKPGDVVLAVDGKPVEDAATFIDTIRQSGGRPLQIHLVRSGQPMTLSGVVAKPRQEQGKTVYLIGAMIDAPVVLAHPNPWRQFVEVMTQTRDTLRSLFSRGSTVKAKHMSGPVGIAHMIGRTVMDGGFRGGLWFIMFLSFNLAIFNLLPIPVLDGGHVFLALVELVSRRRLPVPVAYWMQMVCASLLIMLMVYVTFFDFKRLALRWQKTHEPTPATQTAAPPVTPPPAETQAPTTTVPVPTPAPAQP